MLAAGNSHTRTRQDWPVACRLCANPAARCLSSRTRRLAVSDVVTRGDVPELVRRDLLLGQMHRGRPPDTEYEAKL